MQIAPHMLEDLAAHVLADVEMAPPIDTVELAHRLGLQVRLADLDQDALLVGRTVALDWRLSAPRQQGLVGHECGHEVLLAERLEHTEACASYLGAALQVPAPALARDIEELGVDLPNLHLRHRYASRTVLARRVGELLGGEVSGLCQGQLTWTAGRRPLVAREMAWELSAGWTVRLALPT